MVHTQPNFILSGLIETDLCSIEADLEDVDLPVSKILERAHRRVDSVYFPDSGFASVVADGGAKGAIEVGIIGRDGMTGFLPSATAKARRPQAAYSRRLLRP